MQYKGLQKSIKPKTKYKSNKKMLFVNNSSIFLSCTLVLYYPQTEIPVRKLVYKSIFNIY